MFPCACRVHFITPPKPLANIAKFGGLVTLKYPRVKEGGREGRTLTGLGAGKRGHGDDRGP